MNVPFSVVIFPYFVRTYRVSHVVRACVRKERGGKMKTFFFLFVVLYRRELLRAFVNMSRHKDTTGQFTYTQTRHHTRACVLSFLSSQTPMHVYNRTRRMCNVAPAGST